MLLLSLDTSYSYQNFTLFDCKSLSPLLVYGEDRDRKSLEIFPKIFQDLGINLKEINIFAVNVGPGYSTSLRVGVAMFKTYAQISGKPLIPYSAYEVFAQLTPSEGRYLGILKVSRYWIYSLFEKTSEGFKELIKPSVLDDKAIENLRTERLVLVIPLPFSREFQPLKEKLNIEKQIVLPFRTLSEVGAKVAYRKYLEGKKTDLFSVEPIYFRPAV
ncbi:MAG TPA: hypothetical protein EYH48_00235 [Aquifex aeolicus]|nr:hypothetical protein [Aquificales bacterium]HIP86505.1 hypothetical protein [Aquifex sp.]HIQ25751.1 hypothetical protein [Aquifex aeolicus]